MHMHVKQLWEIILCDVTKLIDPSLLVTNITRQLNVSNLLSHNHLLEGRKKVIFCMEQGNLEAKYAVGRYSYCSTCAWGAEK